MTRLSIFAAASAIALGLAACDDRGAAVDAPEPAPLAELTADSLELPYAEPAPVQTYAPAQAYRWAERAYGLQRAVYDTPPDYGFPYDGVEPMVWETEDDWSLYAEPYEGDYRYYYYEPGAAYPYFVRDRDYGYAYDGAGLLIALFDTAGRYLPADRVYGQAPLAGRYYIRGRDLRNAGVPARRVRISDQAWALRATDVTRTADPWLRAARQDGAWRAWRERDRDRELARFEPETLRRQAHEHRRRENFDARQVAAIERRPGPPPAVAERRLERAEAKAERREDRDRGPRGHEQARAAVPPGPPQARFAERPRGPEGHGRGQPQRVEAPRQMHAPAQAHAEPPGRGRGRADNAEQHGQPAAAREHGSDGGQGRGPDGGQGGGQGGNPGKGQGGGPGKGHGPGGGPGKGRGRKD